jgi:hypothetical protein
MSCVSSLRSSARQHAELGYALSTVKALQAQRFASAYHDLLHDPKYSACASFFLTELYSEKDYSERDAQFARIAGALELTFPDQVVGVAVSLAQLHRVTEELDHAMAQCWMSHNDSGQAAQYLQAWRAVGQRQQREWQLATVLAIGQALSDLTRKRGLRLMLKVMRRPAELAGLGALQTFLETGFDRFGGMAKDQRAVDSFLKTIQSRESVWINRLFDANPTDCQSDLSHALNASFHMGSRGAQCVSGA